MEDLRHALQHRFERKPDLSTRDGLVVAQRVDVEVPVIQRIICRLVNFIMEHKSKNISTKIMIQLRLVDSDSEITELEVKTW